jgi:hypothetical protein
LAAAFFGSTIKASRPADRHRFSTELSPDFGDSPSLDFVFVDRQAKKPIRNYRTLAGAKNLPYAHGGRQSS